MAAVDIMRYAGVDPEPQETLQGLKQGISALRAPLSGFEDMKKLRVIEALAAEDDDAIQQRLQADIYKQYASGALDEQQARDAYTKAFELARRGRDQARIDFEAGRKAFAAKTQALEEAGINTIPQVMGGQPDASRVAMLETGQRPATDKEILEDIKLRGVDIHEELRLRPDSETSRRVLEAINRTAEEKSKEVYGTQTGGFSRALTAYGAMGQGFSGALASAQEKAAELAPPQLDDATIARMRVQQADPPPPQPIEQAPPPLHWDPRAERSQPKATAPEKYTPDGRAYYEDQATLGGAQVSRLRPQHAWDIIKAGVEGYGTAAKAGLSGYPDSAAQPEAAYARIKERQAGLDRTTIEDFGRRHQLPPEEIEGLVKAAEDLRRDYSGGVLEYPQMMDFAQQVIDPTMPLAFKGIGALAARLGIGSALRPLEKAVAQKFSPNPQAVEQVTQAGREAAEAATTAGRGGEAAIQQLIVSKWRPLFKQVKEGSKEAALLMAAIEDPASEAAQAVAKNPDLAAWVKNYTAMQDELYEVGKQHNLLRYIDDDGVVRVSPKESNYVPHLVPADNPAGIMQAPPTSARGAREVTPGSAFLRTGQSAHQDVIAQTNRQLRELLKNAQPVGEMQGLRTFMEGAGAAPEARQLLEVAADTGLEAAPKLGKPTQKAIDVLKGELKELQDRYVWQGVMGDYSAADKARLRTLPVRIQRLEAAQAGRTAGLAVKANDSEAFAEAVVEARGLMALAKQAKPDALKHLKDVKEVETGYKWFNLNDLEDIKSTFKIDQHAAAQIRDNFALHAGKADEPLSKFNYLVSKPVAERLIELNSRMISKDPIRLLAEFDKAQAATTMPGKLKQALVGSSVGQSVSEAYTEYNNLTRAWNIMPYAKFFKDNVSATMSGVLMGHGLQDLPDVLRSSRQATSMALYSMMRKYHGIDDAHIVMKGVSGALAKALDPETLLASNVTLQDGSKVPFKRVFDILQEHGQLSQMDAFLARDVLRPHSTPVGKGLAAVTRQSDRVLEPLRAAANAQADFDRALHFMTYLESDTPAAIARALAKTRDVVPDYQWVGNWDKAIRHHFTTYTYARKMLPLALRNMAKHPERMGLLVKARTDAMRRTEDEAAIIGSGAAHRTTFAADSVLSEEDLQSPEVRKAFEEYRTSGKLPADFNTPDFAVDVSNDPIAALPQFFNIAETLYKRATGQVLPPDHAEALQMLTPLLQHVLDVAFGGLTGEGITDDPAARGLGALTKLVAAPTGKPGDALQWDSVIFGRMIRQFNDYKALYGELPAGAISDKLRYAIQLRFGRDAGQSTMEVLDYLTGKDNAIPTGWFSNRYLMRPRADKARALREIPKKAGELELQLRKQP